MRRTPGFSVLACLSLAIGIGANTAIYSVIDAVLLRPLPHVAKPSRMVAIGSDVVSYPLYRDIADRAQARTRDPGLNCSVEKREPALREPRT